MYIFYSIRLVQCRPGYYVGVDQSQIIWSHKYVGISQYNKNRLVYDGCCVLAEYLTSRLEGRSCACIEIDVVKRGVGSVELRHPSGELMLIREPSRETLTTQRVLLTWGSPAVVLVVNRLSYPVILPGASHVKFTSRPGKDNDVRLCVIAAKNNELDPTVPSKAGSG
jgi:hypothetical protein